MITTTTNQKVVAREVAAEQEVEEAQEHQDQEPNNYGNKHKGRGIFNTGLR